MPIVISTGESAHSLVLGFIGRIVIAERHQRGGADRDGVGTERQRLRNIGAVPDTAGNDELHLPVHAEVL